MENLLLGKPDASREEAIAAAEKARADTWIRRLPDGYGVENFEITPTDMFYVILHYVRYPDGHPRVNSTQSWTHYKTWEAPQADPKGAILGVGANFDFDYAKKIFDSFVETVPLPKYELQKIERGATPYRRPPYSFVADGFVAMGDAACLTKPGSGEGCTSAMVQAEIVEQVADAMLKTGGYLTREGLWEINKRYIDAQGKEFAGMLATLVGAVAANAKENEFFFKHDIVFSKKTFQNMDSGISFSTAEIARMAFFMMAGILTGQLRVSTIKKLLSSTKNGTIIKAHYAAFPGTPAGFEEWGKKADDLWGSVGSMADNIDCSVKN
jgi:hypothetical protein